MNPKIIRINTELNKARGKISELQARVKELERQKTELENTDIIGLVRSVSMTPQELSMFIKAFRENIGEPFNMSVQEDTDNEN